MGSAAVRGSARMCPTFSRGSNVAVKQALSRLETRKKYHDFLVEIRKNQDRRHMMNDLQRIEGMLFHRLRPGLREHALFEQQRTKLQAAIAETVF